MPFGALLNMQEAKRISEKGCPIRYGAFCICSLLVVSGGVQNVCLVLVPLHFAFVTFALFFFGALYGIVPLR